VGGSNPPLLRSAILFFVCLILAIPMDQLEIIINATTNLMGGSTMDASSVSAVILAVSKSWNGAFSAIAAGLAANGISPHL
jgi:hypothetical protein